MYHSAKKIHIPSVFSHFMPSHFLKQSSACYVFTACRGISFFGVRFWRNVRCRHFQTFPTPFSLPCTELIEGGNEEGERHRPPISLSPTLKAKSFNICQEEEETAQRAKTGQNRIFLTFARELSSRYSCSRGRKQWVSYVASPIQIVFLSPMGRLPDVKHHKKGTLKHHGQVGEKSSIKNHN